MRIIGASNHADHEREKDDFYATDPIATIKLCELEKFNTDIWEPACGNKYLTDTEFVLFFREKGVKIYGSFDTKRTWYATPLNQSDKKIYGHPTCKPIDIVKNFIINSSQEGDIVLDPFMGSGTTAVAAKSYGRHFIGFEINEEYYKKACERIKKEQIEIENSLFNMQN